MIFNYINRYVSKGGAVCVTYVTARAQRVCRPMYQSIQTEAHTKLPQVRPRRQVGGIAGASLIRPIASDDIGAIARIFQTQLRKTSAPPTAGLVDYLDRLFVSGPFADASLPSLVYQREDAQIAGFLGVTAQPLALEGAPIRAAVCGVLMVDGHQQDPMAGARLLKAFLAGDQDVSLSETAGDATLSMWRQLRGDVLTRHSLDWLRVIRPGGFAVETMARRIGAARALGPLAGLVDARLTRPGSERGLRWAALSDDFKAHGGLTVQPVAVADFADHIRAFTDSFPIRRDWSDAALQQVLADLPHKPGFGSLRICSVRARGGAVLGAFVFYHRPHSTAHVLDVLAAPERAGVVLDCLLRDAADHGAVAVRGRTAPAIFDALLERRCLMFQYGASVVAARDPVLMERLKRGDAALNGLVGERWSRLEGDNFA